MMRTLLSPSAGDSFKPPAAKGASMTAPDVLGWQNHGRCCAHLHVPQNCSTSEQKEGLQCSLYHPPCSCIPPCWLPSFEHCRRLLLRIVCPDLAAGAVVHLRVAAQPSGNVYVLALQSREPCAGQCAASRVLGACKTPTDAACSQATQQSSARRGRNAAHRGEPVVEKAEEHGKGLRPGDGTRQAGGN